MSQLTDNLNMIASIKSDIKDAIEAKGVDMTGVSFGGYADKIGEITTQFVTEQLTVTSNGTYTPGQGVDGYSQVTVNVSQSVTGYTQKDVTEANFGISILSNSASYVASGAFFSYSKLQQVNLPNCISVYDNAFNTCTSLSYVYLPSCQSIRGYAFSYCVSLLSLNLPECLEINQQAFGNCRRLSEVSLPKCSILRDYVFYYCSSLTRVDLPVCSLLNAYVFAQCGSGLSMLILRSTSVCKLNGGNLFWGTDNCSIFVTKNLLASYKTANNWSSYSDRIFPIEDDFEFSNGLVTGWATSMDSGYLNTLGINANDVISVSMQFLTSISSSTFMNHQNLTSVSISLVEEYPDDLFNGCTGLTEFSVGVSALGDRVFANCTGLERVEITYDKDIVTAGSDLFLNCPNLSEIGIPYQLYSDYLEAPGWSEYSSLMLSFMPLLAFSNGLVYGRTTTIDSTYRQTLGITSNQVVSVSLPNCVSVGKSTFLECHSLKDVYLPNCEYLSNGAFYGANNMNGIDLPKCSFIGDYAFYWCNFSMSYIKLGYSGVCTLEGGNALNQTGALRSIYVPASLVSDYKVASIWSLRSSMILPIPE